MMDLGSGIALGSLCVSGGAVAIAAIRANQNRNGKMNGCTPCKEHSGVIACLESIEKGQDRQEKWLESLSTDIKKLVELR